MKRIIIGIGDSKFSVFHYFAQHLGEALKQLEREVFIVNFKEENLKRRMGEALTSKPECFISFNSIGSDLFFSFFNLIKIPFYAVMVDNPIYHLDRLNGKIRNHLVGYVDRTYLRFHETHFPSHLKPLFLPHAGSISPAAPTEKDDDFESRPVPVLFTGSYWDLDYYEDILSAMPGHAAEVARETISHVLSEGLLSLDDALQTVLERKNLQIQNLAEYGKILMLISNTVRASRRLECLKECSKGDFPLHVYGDRWDKCPFKNRLVIHSAVDFNQALELMTQAKIVLNISAVVPDGSHERVFSSMLNGAVSLTDKNEYFASEFKEDEDILFYSWQTLDGLADKINRLLHTPGVLQSIAAAGQARAMEHHTWLHRAKAILQAINS
jgi:hypothetical protein